LRRQDALAALVFVGVIAWCASWFINRLGWAVVARLFWLVIVLPVVIAGLAAAGTRLGYSDGRPMRIIGLLLIGGATALALWLVLHLAGLTLSKTPLRAIAGHQSE
jgi:hypothetical protein